MVFMKPSLCVCFLLSLGLAPGNATNGDGDRVVTSVAAVPHGPGGEPCAGEVCAPSEYCAVLQTGGRTCMPIGMAAGRPFVVNGTLAAPHLLRVTREEAARARKHDPPGSSWAPSPSVLGGSADAAAAWLDLPPQPARRLLAEWWANVGSAEYASIASFSGHALQLLAVGAPADLVQGALAAATDEVKHARLSFGLAAAYAGLDVIAPASLPLGCGDACSTAPSLTSLALSAARDGCVAETLAAAEAAAAAAKAEDVHVAAALESIAKDEARHAVLGWDTVAWATAGNETATQQVVQLIERAMSAAAAPPPPTAFDGADLEAHGVLSAGSKARVRRAAVQQVISPALLALVSGTGPSQHVAARLRHFASEAL